MTDVVPLNRCGYAGFHCEALVVLLFPAKGKLGWQEVVLQCMVECVSWELASPFKGGVFWILCLWLFTILAWGISDWYLNTMKCNIYNNCHLI